MLCLPSCHILYINQHTVMFSLLNVSVSPVLYVNYVNCRQYRPFLSSNPFPWLETLRQTILNSNSLLPKPSTQHMPVPLKVLNNQSSICSSCGRIKEVGSILHSKTAKISDFLKPGCRKKHFAELPVHKPSF